MYRRIGKLSCGRTTSFGRNFIKDYKFWKEFYQGLQVSEGIFWLNLGQNGWREFYMDKMATSMDHVGQNGYGSRGGWRELYMDK